MKSYSCVFYFFAVLFFQSCGKSLKTNSEDATIGLSSFRYSVGNDSTLELTYGEALTPIAPISRGNVTRCEVSPRPLPIGLNFDSSSCTLFGTPQRPPNSTAHLNGVLEIRTFTAASATVSSGSWTLPYQILQTAPALTFGSVGNKAVGIPVQILNLEAATSGPIASCTVNPLLPEGLSLNPNTCEITGTVNSVIANQTYVISAVGAGGSATASISLAFAFDTPTLVFGSIPTSILVNSSATIAPSSKAGVNRCTIAPALPAGLSFNTTSCAITGTPTTSSPSALYTMTAFPGPGDSSPTTTVNFNLAVNYNTPALGYPIPNVPRIGTSYFLNANIRTGVHHCSVSPALPAGLVLNETTCGVSGIPTGPSPSNLYTVTAFPGPGESAPTVAANFSLEILYLPPTLSYPSPSANPPIVGTAYSLVPSVRSGVDHCSVSPALPPGLNLHTTTCQITGTATIDTVAVTYTVTAYPGPGNSTPTTNAVFNFPVNYRAPSLAYPSINSAGTGIFYTLAPTTKSGVDHCTLSPALPNGLSFDSTSCAISGTPQSNSNPTLYTIVAYPGPGTSTPTFAAQTTLGVQQSVIHVNFTSEEGPLLSGFSDIAVSLTFSRAIEEHLNLNSFNVSNAEISGIYCIPDQGPYTSCSASVRPLGSGPLSVKLKANAAVSLVPGGNSLPVPETELISNGSSGVGLKVGGITISNKLIYSPSSDGNASHDYTNSISQDCTKISFVSTSTNLYQNDPRGSNYDVFYKDLTSGIIRRVSENPDRAAEIACQGPCSSDQSRISHNGRFVIFSTSRTDLGAPPTPAVYNYFNTNVVIVVRDMTGDTFRLASVTTEGLHTGFLPGVRNQNASISDDGRWVVFENVAPNSTSKIYIKDMQDDGIGPDGSGGPLVQIPAAVTVARQPKIDKNANFVIFAGGTNTTGGSTYLWRREDNKTVLVSDPGGFYQYDINSDGTWINFGYSTPNENMSIRIRPILSATVNPTTPLGPATDQYILSHDDSAGVWTSGSFHSGGFFDDTGRKMYYRGLSTNWLGHYQYNIDTDTHTALPQLPSIYQAGIQNPNVCGQGTRALFYTKPSTAPVNQGYQIYIYDLVNYEIIPLSGELPTEQLE